MTDLEMTKLCADALYPHDDPVIIREEVLLHREGRGYVVQFNPLTDDAQAMALVKRFELDLTYLPGGLKWRASHWISPHQPLEHATEHYDLNRAIVACVAKLVPTIGDTLPPQKL